MECQGGQAAGDQRDDQRSTDCNFLAAGKLLNNLQLHSLMGRVQKVSFILCLQRLYVEEQNVILKYKHMGAREQ